MIVEVVVLLALVVLGYHVYLSVQLPGEAKIAFSRLPVVGEALNLSNDPMQLFAKCREQASEIFGMVVMGQRMFFLTDPDAFKVVLRADKSKLSFDRFTDHVLARIFNVGLDSVHNKFDEPYMRSLYQKYLLGDASLYPMLADMQTLLGDILMDVKEGSYDDMYEFIRKVTFQAAVGALFNPETGKDNEVYESFLKFDALFPLALSGIPYAVNAAGNKARNMLLDKAIHARDGVSGFIGRRFEVLDEWKVPAPDVAGSQLAILWASSGNTMPGAFWTVYHIVTHVDALAAVNEELERVIGAKMRNCNRNNEPLVLTPQEIEQLVVLDSCISESLRLSAGSLMIRECVVPQTVELPSGKKYTFRKGDMLGISPIVVHTDPKHYEEPMKFQYDRFINGIDGRPYLPFGAGATYCPGRKFARAEIKCIVAVILSRFDMEVVEGEAKIDGARAGIGIFPPQGKIRMSLKAKQL